MDLRRWQRALDWLICLHIVSYAVCLLLSRNNGWTLPSWGILFPLSALVMSLVVTLNTGWHIRSRDRLFWLLISLGLLCSLAGLLTWAYQGIILGADRPQAGIPLLLMLAGLGWEVGAIAVIMARRNSWTHFRYGMEIFIAITVGIILSWNFIVQPGLHQPVISDLNMTLTLLYPLLDLGLLLAALSLIYTPCQTLPGTVWPWLLFHLFIMIAGNSTYLYLAVKDPHYAGIFNQPLWALAYLFLVPAALNHLENYLEGEEPADESGLVGEGETRSDYLRLLLPYAFLILLVLGMFSSLENLNSLVVIGVVLLLLVMIRQIHALTGHRLKLAKIQNQTGELELQARHRAEELYQKNAQLQTVLDDIQHMAYYDALTNLPNRRLFMQKLTDSLQRARRNNHMLAILFIDLDSFKLINDTMGHSFGDLLLNKLGEKITHSIRDTDTVSRQGGDEFAVLLEAIGSIEEAKYWIEEIQMRIQESFVINDIEVHVAASIGVALYPRHGDNIDNLIKYSDIAMYKAKEMGRNQYAIYTADMNHVFMRRMSLDKALRSAIQNEEFSLYYQPQIDVASGAIAGIEALVRWNNLELGEVPPSELIPVAEENGHIMQIGDWVLSTACRQFKAWQDEGHIIPKVAVNVSPVQFNDEKLVENVKRILGETGLEPQYLELEITEGIAMYNERAVINKLKALKDIGINVALDDFGTGYSCLAYLSQFPVDTLKIDRRFIQNIVSNRDNEILVETIIIMAHNFNISVVAEGVDTLEQFQMLRVKKCDEIQGFLISEPLRSDRLIHLIEKYNDEQIPVRSLRSIRAIG